VLYITSEIFNLVSSFQIKVAEPVNCVSKLEGVVIVTEDEVKPVSSKVHEFQTICVEFHKSYQSSVSTKSGLTIAVASSISASIVSIGV
jgi:hypothetical protein